MEREAGLHQPINYDGGGTLPPERKQAEPTLENLAAIRKSARVYAQHKHELRQALGVALVCAPLSLLAGALTVGCIFGIIQVWRDVGSTGFRLLLSAGIGVVGLWCGAWTAGLGIAAIGGTAATSCEGVKVWSNKDPTRDSLNELLCSRKGMAAYLKKNTTMEEWNKRYAAYCKAHPQPGGA